MVRSSFVLSYNMQPCTDYTSIEKNATTETNKEKKNLLIPLGMRVLHWVWDSAGPDGNLVGVDRFSIAAG